MRHRTDIDGLRALAVVPVILFHAGVGQVPGGFVGVDIFFVISGYLITSLIVSEVNEGRFSLVTFYERRVRRIIPALAVVLAACIVAAFLLFLPQDLKNFDHSLVATAFFVSNVQIYMNLGYFTAPADTQPLLHTWSLAIEEQFYILFPLILMLAFRWSRRCWIGLVFALFCLSFAFSIWVTAREPAAAFLLAPTRVWELMLGALLAAAILPPIESRALREIACLAGLGLIAYALFRFSSTTLFPGPAALIPCLGAALIIYAGEEGKSSLVSKVLRLEPVVFIGLISYSLYLWHWPLLVFGRYWNIVPLTHLQIAGLLATSVVLAALSWAYVEQPFRQRQRPISRRLIFAGAATAMGIVAAFGVETMHKGLPSRFSPEVLAVKKTLKTAADSKILKSCRGHTLDNPCVVGAPVRPTYAVWGDSHAGAMIPAIARLAQRYQRSVEAFFTPGCAPLLGGNLDGQQASLNCVSRNARTMELLESSREIRTVILISYYSSYVSGRVVRRPVKDDCDGFRLMPSANAPLEERIATFERDVEQTVGRLLAAGKTVVLVYPTPDFSFSVPSAIQRILARGGDPSILSLPRANFEVLLDRIAPGLDKIQGPSGRVIRIYPYKRLCNSVRCPLYSGGHLLYHDDNHLSSDGAEFIVPDFEPIFASGAVDRSVSVLSSP